MKINKNMGPTNINPYRKQMEQQQQVEKAANKADKLEISKAAKEMLNGSQFEVQRQEKVDALKRQIDSGDYKVDPQAVAKKMYEFWNKN